MSAHIVRARVALFGVCLLSFSAVHAQPIDYDPRRASELRTCDDHQHRGRLGEARACYTKLLQAPNLLTQAEAAWAIGDVRSANESFRRAVSANPRAAQARVRWAKLFVHTHQYADAVELLREALKIAPNDPQANITLAHVYAERFEGQAKPLLDEALRTDPDAVEAHLLAARMALEESQFAPAERALERAAQSVQQRKQPPLEVYALRAALELSREREPQAWIDRALAYNPRYGAVFQQLAHFEVMRRRYRQATVLLRRAVEVQPDLWSAHADLGANLLRDGEIAAARTHLAKAYEGDPYSPTTVNSLRLLDRIDQFELSNSALQIDGERQELRVRLHRKEAAALRPYVVDLARQSIDQFSRRYGFTLREPVTLELYPDHDDFAVRVAALPGIGLLGVTFGYVVAMDSPSARAVGEFHWGSTLWHEMAHVFTLEATDHRVPRWLSEGLSVFEEWRSGPTPGMSIPPEVIAALHEKRFLPIKELDSGFIRPSYPTQVQVSYIQAGLLCLFIEEQWGFERLAALLRQFTRPTTTEQAIEAALRTSASEFDAAFDAFARRRFSGVLENFGEWERAYERTRVASEKQQWGEVVEAAQRAVTLFPEHSGPGSPYLPYAQALDSLGRRGEALSALERYRSVGGADPAALRKLAQWLDDAARTAEATELLATLNYADPLNAELHAELGERLLAAQQPDRALREFEVLLALSEHDPAAGHFGAARALHQLGDRAASRRAVLDALAAAPHFKPAQSFLLQLIEERNRNE